MKKYLKIFPAFALAVAAGVFGRTVITAQAGESEAVIPETVYIEDRDVSGMTEEEAREELDSYVRQLQNTVFTLTTGDTWKKSPGFLNLSLAWIRTKWRGF